MNFLLKKGFGAEAPLLQQELQVDPPAFKKSRHECSHFLRRLGNMIGGNWSDVFKGAELMSRLQRMKTSCVRNSSCSEGVSGAQSVSGRGAQQRSCSGQGCAGRSRWQSSALAAGGHWTEPGQRGRSCVPAPDTGTELPWLILQDSLSAWMLGV